MNTGPDTQKTTSMSGLADHLPEVRNQYEALPYPPRDPRDEEQRLIKTWLDELPLINHYCFAGRENFKKRFRILVAGGGTGDASIFLAEQLKNTDAEIVHLDLSEASLAIARERARIRGLANIVWVSDSLLNLPSLNLGLFDYINCCGVLHHLADPDAGFRALLSVLKGSGAMGIMVYGSIGRTGVYHMQKLMQLVNRDAPDMQTKISNTSELLGVLPASNWFKRAEQLYPDHIHQGPSGIYDLLLHSQDRAYSVGEIYQWIKQGHGLHVEFTDVIRGRTPYLPQAVIGPSQPRILNLIKQYPPEQQHEIAELIGGTLTTHSFFVTRSQECRATYGDSGCVPFYFRERVGGAEMAALFNTNNGAPFILRHEAAGLSMLVNPGRYGAKILQRIDGKTTFREIFGDLRRSLPKGAEVLTDAALFADFRESFDALNALDRLLLRQEAVEFPQR
jgi:ubiquinone/menaquinone biosynthesis C-methylase UbiE